MQINESYSQFCARVSGTFSTCNCWSIVSASMHWFLPERRSLQAYEHFCLGCTWGTLATEIRFDYAIQVTKRISLLLIPGLKFEGDVFSGHFRCMFQKVLILMLVLKEISFMVVLLGWAVYPKISSRTRYMLTFHFGCVAIDLRQHEMSMVKCIYLKN